MRTRVRNRSQRVYYPQWTTKLGTQTTGKNPSGVIVTFGPTVFDGWDPVQYDNLLVYDISSMTDELPYRTRIGFVDHEKRFTDPPLGVCLRTETSVARRIGPTNNGPYGRYALRYISGSKPWVNLMEWMRQDSNYQSWTIPLTVSTNDDGALIAQATRQAVARLSSLQLSVSLWESREIPSLLSVFRGKGALGKLIRKEALGFFNDPEGYARLLSKYYRMISKGKSGLRKQLVLAASEAQLLWSFGLAPTIQDVKGIIREIRKGSKGFPHSGRTTSSSTNVSDTIQRTGTSNGLVSNLTATRVRLRKDTVSVRVTPITPPGASPELLRLNDVIDRYLGANQLGNIWAVVPFSFMVDWLVSVDDYLDSRFLNENENLKVVWSRSTKLTYDFGATGQYVSEYMLERRDDTSCPTTPVMSLVSVSEHATRYIRSAMAAPSAITMLGRARPSIKKTYLACLIAIGIFGNKR